ncbi:hypothetical protein MAR_031796 [Mya arenaria]|uniref:Uncharacterized protein n=1 Tax=Mya arenaria TaxID=6604 RepID=A0ABY7F845_MYAAR|nr:hypothetical protein MAR_031796 [Mya arenaria]
MSNNMGKMSNAERQRKFRLNRDASPSKRQSYLTKCKENYKKDKLCGKRKLALRKRQKKAIEFQKTLVTPPSSPEQIENQKGVSRQTQQARESKRDNKLKEIEISNLKRKLYSCRKRLNRLKEKSTDIDSPRTKTRRLLRNLSNLRKGARILPERGYNSRIITGMKSTVTKSKQKKQKLLNVYRRKFLSEGNTKPSYTVFARLRPFWVLFPCEADRNTCLCKICDNINLMVNALHKADILSSNKVDDVVKETECDECKYECMYGLCDACKDRKVNIDDKALDKTVFWSQLQTKKEKRLLKDGKDMKEKVISFTVKATENDKASVLVDKLCESLDRFKIHMFNCRSQYRYFRHRREQMNDTERILHIDFSENYVCKMRDEVQGMHFGASKKQYTLHTGVKYIKDNAENFALYPTH